MKIGFTIVVVVFSMLAMDARAFEAATPQRPSFSSDPSTTAAGTLELEAGSLVGQDDVADVALNAKWGAGPATELFLGWSPWLRAAEDRDGPGDVLLGVRHRFVEPAPGGIAAAFQLAGKIPTASVDDGLGSGAPDLTAALTALTSVAPFSLVGYYQAGFLGRPVGDGVLVDHALALAVAAPIASSLAGFVEWKGGWRPESSSTDQQILGGLGLPVRAWFVVDAAVGVSWADGDEFVFGTIGFTSNLGNPLRDFR